MGIREATGYVAHILLAAYWLWVVTSTAPQLRKGSRNRRLRGYIAVIKTSAIAVSTVVVGVIHFWATEWWHVIVALVAAVAIGIGLQRAYRRVVAAPRHRLTLGQRAHRLGRLRTAPQPPP